MIEHDPCCPRAAVTVMEWDRCACSVARQARADEREKVKAEYTPVLMEHLRILADLRAKVEALRNKWQRSVERDPDGKLAGYDRAHVAALNDVLALIDGSSDDQR